MKKAISFGAGVNSIAMTIMLFKRGEIYPVIFADTMAEHPETYCYMDYFEKEFMSRFKQEVIRISPKTHPEYYRSDVKNLGLEDYLIRKKMIPFMKVRFCTMNWKVNPMEAYKTKNNIKVSLIGFAYDEAHRAKNYGDITKGYPLIEEKITRKGCFEIIEKEGLNRPRKSGCFFCPFQRKNQWESLIKHYIELYKKAEFLEENCKRSERSQKIKGNPTLMPSGVSLRELRKAFESQIDMFPDWDFEELEPCMCKL